MTAQDPPHSNGLESARRGSERSSAALVLTYSFLMIFFIPCRIKTSKLSSELTRFPTIEEVTQARVHRRSNDGKLCTTMAPA